MLHPFESAGEILVGRKQLPLPDLEPGAGSDSNMLSKCITEQTLELSAFCQLKTSPP